MSWDILFQELPPGFGQPEAEGAGAVAADAADELAEPFIPSAIGSRAALIEKLKAALPSVDFSDPSWGVLEGPGFTLELNLGDEDVLDSVMLHVRGSDAALGAVQQIAELIGLPPLDCSAGKLIDLTSPQAVESLKAWRAYRDQVLAKPRG